MCVQMVSGSKTTFLVLCMNDILLIGNDIEMLISVKKSGYLKIFSMKDLGEATYILGIRVYRDRLNRVTRLSQSLNLG